MVQAPANVFGRRLPIGVGAGWAGVGRGRRFEPPPDEEVEMIQKILVGTDTTASADLAVQTAAGLALAHDAELLILHVKAPEEVRDAFDPTKAADAATYLSRMRKRFPGVKVETRQEPGDPAERICGIAEDEGIDTIVVGNRGVTERRRWKLRNVPNAVVHCAPCSVFIVDTRSAR
jgi:nucleotide-binding universal stress UspA family protein